MVFTRFAHFRLSILSTPLDQRKIPARLINQKDRVLRSQPKSVIPVELSIWRADEQSGQINFE